MARRYSRWFPKTVKPVRVGLYQTNWRIDGVWLKTWAHWDGEHWGFATTTIENAKPFNQDSLIFPEQDQVWRGLSASAKDSSFCG